MREDPNVIVGLSSPDDAGVYRLTDDIAIIQTLDFITPIVDDPFTFGQIAAANSLSDVYAMGGRPITAMNITCFPRQQMDISVLRDVVLGGLDRMNEAGVSLIGGHTVEDPELKYGLSVTGVVHPDRILRKGGARPGDALVLTKPIGTGIVSTAAKRGQAPTSTLAAAVKSMVTLNAVSARLVLETEAHACTDITGFGLLGHAAEMAEQGRVALRVDWRNVPLLPDVERLIKKGALPGGTKRNRDFRESQIQLAGGLPEFVLDILFDPQTSGGLLVSLPRSAAVKLVSKLRQSGSPEAAIIGTVTDGPCGSITVT